MTAPSFDTADLDFDAYATEIVEWLKAHPETPPLARQRMLNFADGVRVMAHRAKAVKAYTNGEGLATFNDIWTNSPEQNDA